MQQEQHQTNVQQGAQQTSVYNEYHQRYVDNRSVTMNLPPSSPGPPTPRSRRGRSRAPTGRRSTVPRTPQQNTQADESPLPAAATPRELPQAGTTCELPQARTDQEAEASPAPLTPGGLPFSPGVPETPPFSPRVPGTPDCNTLAELNDLPAVPSLRHAPRAVPRHAPRADLRHGPSWPTATK